MPHPACEGCQNSKPYLQLVTYARLHYQLVGAHFRLCHVDSYG